MLYVGSVLRSIFCFGINNGCHMDILLQASEFFDTISLFFVKSENKKWKASELKTPKIFRSWTRNAFKFLVLENFFNDCCVQRLFWQAIDTRVSEDFNFCSIFVLTAAEVGSWGRSYHEIIPSNSLDNVLWTTGSFWWYSKLKVLHLRGKETVHAKLGKQDWKVS